MIRSDELRLFAMHYRNLESAAESQATYLRGAGITGCVMHHADAAALHARTCAEQLEERAAHLEKTLQQQTRLEDGGS